MGSRNPGLKVSRQILELMHIYLEDWIMMEKYIYVSFHPDSSSLRANMAMPVSIEPIPLINFLD